MSEGLWMLKDPGELTRGEVTFDNNSRINVKRPLPWLRNGSEAELIPTKKQALEDPRSSLFVGVPPSSARGNMSGFNPILTRVNEKLLNTVTTNSDERYFPPNDTGHLIRGRDPFDNISSFGLSMSHSPTDSMFGIDYGGIRKVKVSEVRDSGNFMPISTGPSHSRDIGGEATAHGYSTMDNSNVSLFQTYDQEDVNVMKSIEPYGRKDDNFLSIRQSFNKGDGTEAAVGHKNEADSNIMPRPLLFSKSNFDGNSIPEKLCKVISMENQSNKGDTMNSMRHVYKGDNCVSACNNCNYNVKFSSASTAQSVSNCESHVPTGHPIDMGESNIISASMIGSYDPPLGQTAGSHPTDLIVKNATSASCTAEALSVGAESSCKRKDDGKLSKKILLNNFPSNVRSLLSTGILDEAPVKYTAWSQEKVLPGIIKGPGYLCGCQSCNFSKVINAYEFERHAGCKTKHPNNHIHFDNGKTIYGVVQELKSTPPNLLFDVIQSITGSPINQKAFRLWKESFLAATRELERIYSKDAGKQFL